MADFRPSTGHGPDAALLGRARAGDGDAFGELYTREVDAARRLATILVGEQGTDELVSESFARVLTQLQAGRGPTDDFRAYLHVTIRNGFRDGLRATQESPSSDQPWLLDDVLPPVEELVEDLDREVAVTALATLPKSWQQVLWHLEVEGRKPAEVATILDMDSGAVSSLAYRAREGLKRAYLDQHLRPAAGGLCGWTQRRMSQYVRGDLSPRAQQKVADHLDECSDCRAAFQAVDRVNQKLALWLFPVVLWGLASADKGGLLWIAGAGGGAAAGGSGPGGTGSSGTSTTGSTGAGAAGANPVVLGAAAVAVACAVAGSVALALTVGNDKSGSTTTADPSDTRSAPTDDPKRTRPADRSTDGSTTGVVDPADPQTDVAAVPVGAEPTTPSGEQPGPTSVPSTEPPPTEPPPSTEPPPTEEPAAPRLAGLQSRRTGLPVLGPWEMGVSLAVEGSDAIALEVEYRFSELVLLLGRSGAGWRCDGIISALNPFDGPVRCTYGYSGGDVPDVVLNVVPVVADPRSGPSTSVRLYADGKLVDTGRF